MQPIAEPQNVFPQFGGLEIQTSSTALEALTDAVIYLVTYAALLSANRVKQVIGRTGDDILRRLLGVILAALAIQFIADGLRQIMAG